VLKCIKKSLTQDTSSGTVQGAVNLSGTLAGAGSLTLAGAFNFNGGLILNSGGVYANGTLNITNSPALGEYEGSLGVGLLVNNGVATWDSGNLVLNGGGVVSNTANGIINWNAAGTVNNQPPTLFANAGQINVNIGGGNTATIDGPFNNSGTVNIQSGTLSAIGGYTSTNGTLNFGIISTSSFGQLALPGHFALNDTLGAVANGYTPRAGDSFPLISYGSETGIFNAFNLPPDANWEINYGKTVFSLVVSNLNAPFLTLQPVTPPLITNGFTLLMLGPIGSNYMIQASTNLSLSDWVTLTNSTSVDTSFYYTDTTATNHTSRVFRAVMQ
jgi:hypothetical protein